MSEKTEPRKASAPELVAGIALLAAALVLTGSVLMHRLKTAPKSATPGEVDPLKGNIIVPDVAAEGLSYAKGPELLFVDSTPAGEVVLDGQSLGPTPYSTNLSCSAGASRQLEVKKSGYASAKFAIECGKGTARVSATLKRGK